MRKFNGERKREIGINVISFVKEVRRREEEGGEEGERTHCLTISCTLP